ncbi:MAG: pyridine nucleotide-disulfide oxidoreductase [Burkholderiaceae bacterium]|nr:pyridine nucleotide-disulfide oxidoreductase [Burkholderiaceae bacterium]
MSRVAVVGSGPSGFYAAEALLKSPSVEVDMFERLPVPYGLVRYGVAPDHPRLKLPALAYERIGVTPGFRFIGGVKVGRDLSAQELRDAYDAVVFCHGAETDRALGVAGEALAGSHTATEFVGWYNGHPDFRDRLFDLSHDTAVIIGHGNVAADVCRILAKPVDELAATDIAQHALDALAASRVREIVLVGRRGPAQAKFSDKELRELGEVSGTQVAVDRADLELGAACAAELEGPTGQGAAWNMALLREFAARPARASARRIRFRFLESPAALYGRDRLEGVVLEKNRLEGPAFEQRASGTGRTVRLDCGLLFRSVGYKGVRIDGVPFDDDRGIIPNRDGRVISDASPDASVDASVDGSAVPGLYCAGWIKRGANGVIGTNRADAAATIESLLADLVRQTRPARKSDADALLARLAGRGIRWTSFEDWKKIDAAEIRRGAASGKPREKFVDLDEMYAALD